MNRFFLTRKIFTRLQEWFSYLGVIVQIAVIILIGALIVFLSSFLIGSLEESYKIFMDPPTLGDFRGGYFKIVFSFIIMLVGIVLSGFIISVLSSSLDISFRNVRNGKLNYYGNGHTLIVNYNHKIYNLLHELNLMYKNDNKKHQVVLFIKNEEQIEELLKNIQLHHYKHLRVFVRQGDIFSWERYIELSILKIFSIIVLSNNDIKDSFTRDNANLQVLNMLCSQKAFQEYLEDKKKSYLPVKAISEFSDIGQFEKIVSNVTNDMFLPIAPEGLLAHILNISIVDADFYHIWSELMSFAGYKIYFVDAKAFDVQDKTIKELSLRHQEGVVIGISKKASNDGELRLFLNAHNEVIEDGDYLIVISKSKEQISFAADRLQPADIKIEQPKEVYKKNIVIFGDYRDFKSKELLHPDSMPQQIFIKYEELFEKNYFDKWLYDEQNPTDTILLNIEDEKLYRVALFLKTLYSQKEFNRFVFVVDDALIAQQLDEAGFKNTILSHLLVSRYIAQVSNQRALFMIYKMMFIRDGAEINLLDVAQVPHGVHNIAQLKVALISSGMTYLGTIDKEKKVCFESDDFDNALKIIVLSCGNN